MFHAGYEGIPIIAENPHQYAGYVDFLQCRYLYRGVFFFLQYLDTRMNHQREFLLFK